MSLAALILKNLWFKKSRSIGIASALGLAVVTVVTLTVVSRGRRSTPGVKPAVGVLLETQHLNAANPLFIEIGIPPDQLSQFGVAGRPYGVNASHEMMLGWRAVLLEQGAGAGGNELRRRAP